jgi:hypothetical protein
MTLSDDDLGWAASLLISAALSPQIEILCARTACFPGLPTVQRLARFQCSFFPGSLRTPLEPLLAATTLMLYIKLCER